MMEYWNERAKRLLKSELVKRGVSNNDLASKFKLAGSDETKASIDSKISRGSFSASFFLQSLSLIGCSRVDFDDLDINMIAAEPSVEYKNLPNEK